MARRRPRKGPERRDDGSWAQPGRSLLTRYKARIVEEQIRVLRLLRAIDRAGVEPKPEDRVTSALVRLAEYDAHLTATLDLFERERRQAGGEMPETDRFLALGPDVREDVLAALAPAERRRVEEALPHTQATEAEVWLDVERLRRERRKTPKGEPAGLPTAEEMEARRREAVFAVGEKDFVPKDAQVARLESRSLPRAADTRTWLARLPANWLEVMARLHEVGREGPKPMRVARLARALGDADHVADVLTRRVGASERRLAGRLALLGEIPVASLRPDTVEGLAVAWDWMASQPTGVGAKLRSHGLAYVGRRRGERTLAVPDELRKVVFQALHRAAPEVLEEVRRSEDRALRERLAAKIQNAPFDDPDLQRWKTADRAVHARIAASMKDVGLEEKGATDTFFGEMPRVVRGDHDIAGLVQYLFLCWRPGAGAPTRAETLLAKEGALPKDESAVLQSLVRSVPSLWRTDEVERGVGLWVTDALRPHLQLLVHDRTMSIGAETGWLLPMYVYPVGLQHYASLVAQPVPPGDAERAVAWLEERFRRWAARTGQDEEDLFLREEPQRVSQASYAVDPEVA